jgi:XRE family aerobic/anaerobic benzoate catabolism transcriptional regulator
MSPDPEAAEAAFLHRLGERVRHWRGGAGVTRKSLAASSGVSERYLAQLESGQGNISVLLLRKVARAMGVPVESLVREEERPARAGRIALLGLRGAGKSTLGRMLADDLGVPFVELNREIERLAGCSVGEVHALYGLTAYRRYERRALEETLHAHAEAVIATPGGLVSDPGTFGLLLAHCRTVWLQATPEEHMARVIAQGDTRPMQGNAEAMEDLRRILAGREAFYAKADVTCSTSGRSLAEAFATLRAAVDVVAAARAA